MTSEKRTYDVFISHSASDAKLAGEIAAACRASGLGAVSYTELIAGENPSDTLWEALAESTALLVILSPAGLSPNMAIELGAARAWNKPIFGVITDPSYNGLPFDLPDISLCTPGKIDDIIRAIKLSSQELNDGDRNLLADLYASKATPVDALALNPARLEELVKGFRSRTGKAISGERLLSEMLRMRKQGRLPSVRLADRPRPRKGTA